MLPDICSVAFFCDLFNDHGQQCIVDIAVFILRFRDMSGFSIKQGRKQFFIGKPVRIVSLQELLIAFQILCRKELPPEAGLHVQQLANRNSGAFFKCGEILSKRIVKIQFSLFPKLQDGCCRERLRNRPDLKNRICVYSGFPVCFNGIDAA